MARNTPSNVLPSSRLVQALPMLELLNPRRQWRPGLMLLAVGLVLWGVIVYGLGMPMWGGTCVALGLLLHPAVRKWQDDLAHFGTSATVLSVLLCLQGVHMLEHISQWIQFHILLWPAKDATGLLMAGNVEVIHFLWNWSVVAVTVYLIRQGMRNRWAWVLLGWGILHSLEHTYLLVQYVDTLQTLLANGRSLRFAEGLPGILGKNGWVAGNKDEIGALAFICQLAPGLATAPRLDVHWWWNVGETVLLALYAHVGLRQIWGQRGK